MEKDTIDNLRNAVGWIAGFSLVELMIVIAVLGIIAAFAYPSYEDQMRKARRSDAHSALSTLAFQMERYFSNENEYTVNLTVFGYDNDPTTPDTPEGYWGLNATAGPTGNIDTSFLLTANLAAGFSDPACSSLTLDSRGVRGPSSNCWR